ncbi:hypothetical protein ANCCAN_16770 [Ancylostoma caninum]|uniref:Uncharacterized protein n=1 Tax=Ancylostoma caninum TaxID=29170 RepID=A0A368FYR5_ANCCA|nr:hypothetical protein ANCCAN_16770 [Ancylostoma caninum]
MLTRFQLIVKDLDLMKVSGTNPSKTPLMTKNLWQIDEARDWMMSHLELLISLGKGIDEGFDET